MNAKNITRNSAGYIAIVAVILIKISFAVFVWSTNHTQPKFPKNGIWFCSERNSYIEFDITESKTDVRGCEVFKSGGIQVFDIEFSKDGRTLYFVDRMNKTFLFGTIEYHISQSPNEFQIIESNSHKRYQYVLTNLNNIMDTQRT